MGSTRLPGKVMADLGGRPILDWVITAAKNAKLVDQVWVATDFKSPEVVDYCSGRCECFMGSEDDVLSRFKAIAEMTEADLLVRLTADCPLLDPGLIDRCIEIRGASTEQWPDGMDVQCFAPVLLENGDTEHVVPVDHPFPQVPNPFGNRRHIRMTVDTPEDLQRVRELVMRKAELDRICR